MGFGWGTVMVEGLRDLMGRLLENNTVVIWDVNRNGNI